jgi:hypothetical protein
MFSYQKFFFFRAPMRVVKAFHHQTAVVRQCVLHMLDFHFSEKIQESICCQVTIKAHLHIVTTLLPVIPCIWEVDEAKVLEPAN